MIIRSQSKDMILNMECIATIYINELEYVVDTKRIVFNVETEKCLLGKYSTEEKAIKVLDMICEKYKEPIVRANYTDNESLIYANSVFQMPKDSEV